MTGKTHRAGGMLVSIVGFAVLKQNNLLLSNVNPALQWLIMYPFCMWGSVASDLDHHWESCPVKDYPSRAVNMALHVGKPFQKLLDKTLSDSDKKRNPVYKLCDLLNAKHRSWQTHSDLTLFAMLYLLHCVTSGKFTQLGAVDVAVASLIITGICLGVIAHFILDIITPEGIWCVTLVALNKISKLVVPKSNLPQKVHLVPKSEFFTTGGRWEQLIRKILNISTAVAVVWMLYVIVSPYLPFEVSLFG